MCCVGILDHGGNDFIVSHGCWGYGLGFGGSNAIYHMEKEGNIENMA